MTIYVKSSEFIFVTNFTVKIVKILFLFLKIKFSKQPLFENAKQINLKLNLSIASALFVTFDCFWGSFVLVRMASAQSVVISESNASNLNCHLTGVRPLDLTLFSKSGPLVATTTPHDRRLSIPSHSVLPLLPSVRHLVRLWQQTHNIRRRHSASEKCRSRRLNRDTHIAGTLLGPIYLQMKANCCINNLLSFRFINYHLCVCSWFYHNSMTNNNNKDEQQKNNIVLLWAATMNLW